MTINYTLPISSLNNGELVVNSNIPGFVSSVNGTIGEDCFYYINEDSNGKYLRQVLISDGTNAVYRTEIGADGTNSYIANFNDAPDKGPSARQEFSVEFKSRVSDLALNQKDQVIIFQVHQVKFTAPTFSPLVSILLTDNGYYAQVRRCYDTDLHSAGSITQYYDNYCLGAFSKDTVDTFVIYVSVGTNPSNGSITLYRNGVKKLQVSQPTRLDIDGGSGLYIKQGIYVPGWVSTSGGEGRKVQVDLFSLKAGDTLSDFIT